MRPEFRYFKCALSVEPIKSLDDQWRKDRKLRDKKLDAFMNVGEEVNVIYLELFVV